MSEQCAKCGSYEIVPRAQVLDQGLHSDGTLKVQYQPTPSAFVFKGTVKSPLSARVCGECGFVELFADNAKALYDAYANADPLTREG